MADQPDPPDEPDPPERPDQPDEWQVYRSDATPDPEPVPSGTPLSPYAPPVPPTTQVPQVPYGVTQTPSSWSVTMTRTWAAPRLILVMVLVAVIGGGVAAAFAIFAAVDGGISGLGGVDAKDSDDFAKLVDKIKEDKGTTEVQQVGFYTDYFIVYLPYTTDPDEDRQISYTWRGGGLDEWTRSTSSDPTFDLQDIDTDVIDGMCDPVLKLAHSSDADDCYIFLAKPTDGKSWFRTSASDDFSRSYWVNYDLDGNEVERGHT